jgi:hypothetical protein
MTPKSPVPARKPRSSNRLRFISSPQACAYWTLMVLRALSSISTTFFGIGA